LTENKLLLQICLDATRKITRLFCKGIINEKNVVDLTIGNQVKNDTTIYSENSCYESNMPKIDNNESPDTLSESEAVFYQEGSDSNDVSKGWGHSFRDNGAFGSHPGCDDYGDESSP
jgi:hypothetical protein